MLPRPAIIHPETGAADPLSLPMRIVIGVMFFSSGMVALLYEGAWQREFTLLFGSSAPAIAAVLAGYFAGMGLGAFVLGRFASRWRRPLLTYAVLEMLIAIGALLVSPILDVFSRQYVLWFESFHGSETFPAVKALLAFVSIALPTFAMGGTLPVLAQLFEKRRARFGQLIGWLYVLNTAGAAVGAFFFPHILFAAGMARVLHLCVFINLVIAVVAALLARNHTPSGQSLTAESDAYSPRRSIVRACHALAFASGLFIFVLQVAWNRAFAQVHENSIHSFALIVTLFIVAIAVGAQLARILLGRDWTWQQVLGRCWFMGGLLLMFSPHLFVGLTDRLRFVAPAHSLQQLLKPAVLMLLPIVLLAVGLPALLHALAANSKQATTRFTGTLLSVNIAGSVVGALLAGFVLPQVLGLWNSLVLSGGCVVAISSVLLLESAGQRLAASVCLVIGATMLFRSDLPLTRIDASRGEQLIALREGAHGIVAVVERTGSRRLKLNNHYVLGGTAALGDERFQGHLPFLLHREPDRVAFLGYGTGITAGAAMFHDTTNVIALELVPEVTELAREYFADVNLNFGAARKVIIEDARNYLRGSSSQFDVIVGDLVVPWRHGEGALYTREHFEAAKARLTEGGVYCCWLPMFQLGREDFEIILRTFLDVFPAAQVWRGDFSPREPALALVSGLNLPPEDRHLKMQPDPANPHLRFPEPLWMHFVGVVSNAHAGPLNTENRPIVELRTRRPTPFVGRELAAWEQSVMASSRHLTNQLTMVQQNGWTAGELMREFALLYSENRHAEAQAIALKIRELVGEEAGQVLLGP